MSGEHLSELELATLLLDGPAAAELRAHADACEACRARALAARADAGRFTEQVLPRTLDHVRRHAEPWWVMFTRPRLLVPLGACLAAAVVLFAVRPHQEPASKATLDDTRPVRAQAPSGPVRGAAALRVFARRGELRWQVGDGGEVAPGDALRFVIEPAGARFVLLLARTGDGEPTVVYPPGGERSVGLPAGASVELPGELVLDDQPGPSQLFGFVTAKPLERRQALALIKPSAVGALVERTPQPLIFKLVKRAPR